MAIRDGGTARTRCSNTNCSHRLLSHYNFCPNCGKEVETTKKNYLNYRKDGCELRQKCITKAFNQTIAVVISMYSIMLVALLLDLFHFMTWMTSLGMSGNGSLALLVTILLFPFALLIFGGWWNQRRLLKRADAKMPEKAFHEFAQEYNS